MTQRKSAVFSRRLFLGGVAASTLAARPAAGQEQPPIIEPIEPIGPGAEPTPVPTETIPAEAPIAPDEGPTGTIEQIAEEEARP